MWTMLAVFVALAVLGPVFGADSRDGRDWARNGFWLRRRPEFGTAAPEPGRTPAPNRRTVAAAR